MFIKKIRFIKYSCQCFLTIKTLLFLKYLLLRFGDFSRKKIAKRNSAYFQMKQFLLQKY